MNVRIRPSALISVAVVVVLWGCRGLAGAGAEPRGDAASVVEGNTGFALDLYGRLRSREGNLFLSPYSISTALAMTYAGARGRTEEEMRTTLRFALGLVEVPC